LPARTFPDLILTISAAASSPFLVQRFKPISYARLDSPPTSSPYRVNTVRHDSAPPITLVLFHLFFQINHLVIDMSAPWASVCLTAS